MLCSLSVEVRPWESDSRPRSLREVPGVIQSAKFPDKGPFGGPSKPAGRSASEPRCSLVTSYRGRRPRNSWGKAGMSGETPTVGPSRTGHRGIRGDTQGQMHKVARETLNDAPIKGQRPDIRQGRNSGGSFRESELPIVPFGFQGQHNLGRGKGQCLHRAFDEAKDQGIANRLITPEHRELQRKLYLKAKQEDPCESRGKKMMGKSRSGGRKPNVRFDEGELESWKGAGASCPEASWTMGAPCGLNPACSFPCASSLLYRKTKNGEGRQKDEL